MTTDTTRQRIVELFEAALLREPSERTAFLAGACGGDQKLADEVGSLVAEYDRLEGTAAPVPGGAATAQGVAQLVKGFYLAVVAAGRTEPQSPPININFYPYQLCP